MERSELFQKIRHIEIVAKQLVLDTFSGMYASAFKGQGIELADIREFQTGDDYRSIDWAKTAQMGRPFVKNFREERDLLVMLMCDVSASLHFASHFECKKERLAEIGALIAFSAIYNHDKVGLLLFSDKVEKMVLPKRGSKHGVRLIRELLAYEPSRKKTSIADALDHLNIAMKKRCICFLLSDFMAENYERQLGLTAKKNDLIAIRVYDPFEEKWPTVGLSTVQDLETGRQFIVDMNEKTSNIYQALWKKKDEEFHSIISKTGSGAIEIDTKGSFVQHLIAYFNKRKKTVSHK
ncbi:MAG: DUF58 domain-containing protein [Verrucomicrobia bacterium]|nr:DUF58 domain-containing protein [Verrucomicrobiota bacterium]